MKHELMSLERLQSFGVSPKFFGLGFIQLKISDSQRVHFYHPSLVANVPEEELHDHRYDFHSEVLAGALVNEIWDFRHDRNGDHVRVQVSCDPNNPAKPGAPLRGTATKTLTFTTVTGGSYEIRHDQFHRVAAESCVTLITRKEVVKDLATVIRGTGAEEVCPFSVQMSEERCWEIIAEMVGQDAYPGYHLRPIEKGVLGEGSKILEEADEFRESLEQGVSLMALIELSDMQGAVRAYLERHHPGMTIEDLNKFSDVTRRAFENGHRN